MVEPIGGNDEQVKTANRKPQVTTVSRCWGTLAHKSRRSWRVDQIYRIPQPRCSERRRSCIRSMNVQRTLYDKL